MTYKLPTPEQVKAVDLSWQRYLLPRIHKEGVKILCWMLAFLCSFFRIIFSEIQIVLRHKANI